MQPVASVTAPAEKPVVEMRPAVAERCRNCGAAIDGNFCANCGQETAVELSPAGRFLREAAGVTSLSTGGCGARSAPCCFAPDS
jgi:hypothetical protein